MSKQKEEVGGVEWKGGVLITCTTQCFNSNNWSCWHFLILSSIGSFFSVHFCFELVVRLASMHY
eukprot:m.205156 g.205156  ORF g.205156 m.205156 type:complete len:64 (-) comp16892_c1_seq1:1639-1830(-)